MSALFTPTDSDAIQYPVGTSWPSTDRISVSAFCRPDGLGSNLDIVSKWDFGAGEKGFTLIYSNFNDAWFWEVGYDGSNTDSCEASTTPASGLGTIYHLGGTWVAGTTGGIRIYVDGIDDTIGSPNTSGTSWYDPDRDVVIGSQADESNYFNGALEHIAVWFAELNAREMLALANGTSPIEIRPADLMLYVPLWGVADRESLAPGDYPSTITGTPVDGVPLARTRGIAWEAPRRASVVPSGGGATKQASATIAGVHGLTADGTRVRRASASVAGQGTLSADGTRRKRASASVAGASALVADGIRRRRASADLAGASALVADAVRRRLASAGLAGVSALVADGTKKKPGSAAIAGASALVADGTRVRRVSSSIAGVSSLVADFTRSGIISGSATIAGVHALVADGTRRRRASAALSGSSSLVADAVRLRRARATVAGQASLTAIAIRRRRARATIAASLQLVADLTSQIAITFVSGVEAGWTQRDRSVEWEDS